MKAVLDANVLVSAAIGSRGAPGEIVDAWRSGLFDLLIRDDILAELADVLRRPQIRKRHAWDDTQIDDFLSGLLEVAMVTPGTLQVMAVVGDPDDDMYLACAIEGEADYVVSGDQHLRQLGSYRGVPIVSPRQFLGILSM